MELLIKSYPILALSASSVEIIIQLSHKFPFIRHSYKKFHFAFFEHAIYILPLYWVSLPYLDEKENVSTTNTGI